MRTLTKLRNSHAFRLAGIRTVLNLLLVVLLSFGLLATQASAKGKYKQPERSRDVSFLWYIGGTHELFDCEIPATDAGTTTATCHQHVLLDLETDRVVGFALDATADVDSDGSAVWATGTTTFHITRGRFKGAVLQVRGTGTIQPTVIGNPHFQWTSDSVDFDNTPITHIAGIFPDPGENQVLKATGKLAGSTGKFALFGGLDLSEAGSATFNCIFKIDLEVPKKSLSKKAQRRSKRDD